MAQVSVIIPVRDALAVLGPQLEALGAQVDAPDFHVILADNGLNGDLLGLAREVAPTMQVDVVDATAEPGTAYARNMGIFHAPAEKLLFCDADDVVGPTWVRDGALMLEEVPFFNGGAIPFTAAELDRSITEIWKALDARLPDYVAQTRDMPEGTYPVLLGCSFGMRRSFAQRLGGFDRAFGSQAEDNDLAFRAQGLYGSVPVAGYVAIAYRVRPREEGSFGRSFHAGFKHAELCARHGAWGLTPSYQGHWLVRPLKEAAKGGGFVGTRADNLGRLAGLVAGRSCFRVAKAPAPRLGVSDPVNGARTSAPPRDDALPTA